MAKYAQMCTIESTTPESHSCPFISPVNGVWNRGCHNTMGHHNTCERPGTSFGLIYEKFNVLNWNVAMVGINRGQNKKGHNQSLLLAGNRGFRLYPSDWNVMCVQRTRSALISPPHGDWCTTDLSSFYQRGFLRDFRVLLYHMFFEPGLLGKLYNGLTFTTVQWDYRPV